MKSYLQIYYDIKNKLDRELTLDEVKFLQWVFNRYVEEEKEQSA
ncbi:hypothetical protein [Ornithinibacillus bavariensis]|uniref:Uncharacterized protein n=1 Tax=Ornithinibacillus bavariensis TaxID=545502 RepID=A0A920C7L3_9BACI|nr:hypothetical protein [Ornithinibacillus bavariensis]GIO26802.1 hypothetical protein J43TS3_14130 [Ornithinibacillus bavariensis]